jgi:hypothetical protein
MLEIVGAKRGRPVSENAKNYRYSVRLDEYTMHALEEISFNTGKSKSEVVREGLQLIALKYGFY